LQSGGQLENGEKIANKLMHLIRIAIKMPTSDERASSFKKITGNLFIGYLCFNNYWFCWDACNFIDRLGVWCALWCTESLLLFQLFALPIGSEKGAPRSTSTYRYMPDIVPTSWRKYFLVILDTQHYRIQPNNSQSQNKIVTSLPTKSLLFNK